ncbi:unnamed protein product [Blepharisma stoltei]|uniref:Tetratricopeptide repeat protein n=1 Tax=Blepharisma stoltei TaxID=1481888 RepID=A0AAU9JSK1_9CILI|nr:unnamed protein product [Blepharisma stoltei]
MDIKRCSEPKCKNRAKCVCNCPFSETYLCKKHIKEHYTLHNGKHNSEMILWNVLIEETKQEILEFLEQEKSKNFKLRKKIRRASNETIRILKNISEELIKEMMSDWTLMNDYYLKISQAEKLSKSEDDLTLNLLALRTDKAIKIIKDQFSPSSVNSRNAEVFCILSEEIEQIAELLKKEKSEAKLDEKLCKLEKLLKDHDINQKNADKQLANEEDYSSNAAEIYLKCLLYHKSNDSISTIPNKDITYDCIGSLFYNENRYEEAVQHFNDAIEANPHYAIYYSNKGDALNKLGRKEEAWKCYNEAIEKGKNQDEIYNNVGNFLYNDCRYKEAIEYYNNAIWMNPNKALYHQNKGDTLYRQYKIDEAIECYEQAIWINKNQDALYCKIGDILFQQAKTIDWQIFFFIPDISVIQGGRSSDDKKIE